MRIRFFNTFEPVTSLYHDLLPYLTEEGAFVEVVVSRSEYRSGRGRLEQLLNHPRIRITYLPVGPLELHGRYRKLWIMLSYIFGAIAQTLFGPSVDLNFFMTQPPVFSVWGFVLKVVRRQRYCCLVMDVYPDVAIRDGMLPERAIVTRLLIAMSRLGMRRADAVIAIGRCMKLYLEREGVPTQRMHVITNWANETQIVPVSRAENPLRQQLDLKDSFVVLYSGNMGVSHTFDDMIEVADRCHSVEDLRFVFIGDGIRRSELEEAKRIRHLDNVLLLPFQPVENLAYTLSLGDVHFVSLRSGFEGLVVPSKAYGSLTVARPIIYQGNASGEIARMVRDEQIGIVVSLSNPDELEKAILRYYHHPNLAAEEGRKALSLAHGRFSRQESLNRYRSLLFALTEHCQDKLI